MLQPASVIASIESDSRLDGGVRFPGEVAREPEDESRAATEVDRAMAASRPVPVLCEEQGFVTLIRGDEAVELACSHDGLVAQRARVGDYVLPGDLLAEVWGPTPEGAAELGEALHPVFQLGRQRTLPQDVGFPVRQLADVALKGLSPSINDPTTAENAMATLTGILIRFAKSERPSAIRVDEDGTPRLLTTAPAPDDLVRLGFDQVREAAAPHPVVVQNLLSLLDRLAKVAGSEGLSTDEIGRQARLLRQSVS